MRAKSLVKVLLGVDRTVVEDVWTEPDPDTGDPDGCVVVAVRPTAGARGRCGLCGRRCRSYDAGGGRRRWRALDFGVTRVWLEADAPRVTCKVHGVRVAAVPWARHGAGHTRMFDDTAAWLATVTSQSAATQLLRIAWRTVGSIITRVWEDTGGKADRFAGVTRVGIDEVSYRKGHSYLTVVVDHDTGRLLWAGPGKGGSVLDVFFALLGEERCAAVTHVTADGASWIHAPVTRACPDAVVCLDPFHVVGWATKALDEVRRDAWNAARGNVRKAGRSTGPPSPLKAAKYALLKNPENLTSSQQVKLDWVARNDPRLYRAYLLKEGLRYVFRLDRDDAEVELGKWLSWARRCRIPQFVDLARTITRHKAAILATIEHGLSNGIVEGVNTKVRLLTRVGFGFHSPEPLIALAMLTLGGHRPVLPGRP